MKAKLLQVLALVLAAAGPGRPAMAQDQPGRFAVMVACDVAADSITEMKRLAPHATGVSNRTRAWVERKYSALEDLWSLFFGTEPAGLSEVARSAITLDFQEGELLTALMQVAGVDYRTAASLLPDKLDAPEDYVAGLEFVGESIIGPRCRRLRRG